jgi:hypothetical protein
MEYLGQGYLDVMSMPIGRRKRFCDELEHKLRQRAAKNRNLSQQLKP